MRNSSLRLVSNAESLLDRFVDTEVDVHMGAFTSSEEPTAGLYLELKDQRSGELLARVKLTPAEAGQLIVGATAKGSGKVARGIDDKLGRYAERINLVCTAPYDEPDGAADPASWASWHSLTNHSCNEQLKNRRDGLPTPWLLSPLMYDRMHRFRVGEEIQRTASRYRTTPVVSA